MGGYTALFVHMCLRIQPLTRRNIIPPASLGLFVSLILCLCFRDFAESGSKFVKFVLCALGFSVLQLLMHAVISATQELGSTM